MLTRHIYIYDIGILCKLSVSNYSKLSSSVSGVCLGAYHCSDSALFRRPIIPTTHYSDGPFFRQCKIELNPQIHGLTRSQVYPTGWFVGQANLDGTWPRQNVLERKRSFYPRLYIPDQHNCDRPTCYGES